MAIQLTCLIIYYTYIAMPRRCPPGVICFENVTIVILVLLLLAVLWYIGSVAYAKGVSYTQPQPQPPPATSAVFMPTMTSALSIPSPQRSNDVLLDLYQPPLRDDRYFIRDEYDIMSRMLPPQPSLTRRRQDTEYRQRQRQHHHLTINGPALANEPR